MTPQASLFDAPVTAGTARKGDPWSSQQAAKQVRPSQAHRAIRDAFAANDGTGTLDSACAAVSMLRGSVSRRISDMKERGWIEQTGTYVDGDYGSPLAVWRLTEKGAEA